MVYLQDALNVPFCNQRNTHIRNKSFPCIHCRKLAVHMGRQFTGDDNRLAFQCDLPGDARAEAYIRMFDIAGMKTAACVKSELLKIGVEQQDICRVHVEQGLDMTKYDI